MANRKLGIDVEIKYPTAKQIGEAIRKEWNSVKASNEVKVNVTADKNSLRSMRKKIQDFLKTADFDFELRINSTKAMGEMMEIRKEVNRLRKATEDEIELKFTGIKEQSKFVEETTKSIEKSSKVQQKADTDRITSLRDVMNVQKEINGLRSKQVGAGAQEQAIYNKRIEELVVQLNLAKREYKEAFGSNANDDWMLDNVKRIGEFNVELKEAKQTQRETADIVRDYNKLLNEEFKIQKELQKAGENQSQVLEEQLVHVKSRQRELLESHNLEERMTDAQRDGLNNLKQQNEYQLKLTQAKREDKELADRQKDAYRELKNDLKDIHKIQVKINDLQAKSDAGVITAKEEDTLIRLKEQLDTKQDMHNLDKQLAQSEGLITKEIEDSLDALDGQYRRKEKISQETAEINADLKKTNNLYDELISSVKRVESLTKDLASAGSREADVIRKAIKAEEDKQGEIRETLKAQERVNNAREDEYATMKRINAEQEEINAERAQARQTDQYNQNSTIGMFNPMTVVNEGKQAAMEIYDVVSTLDAQLINIEKVADASEQEMDRFKENIFDFASDVGKSADEYGTSVERWVTAGFELSESIEMAQASTMGAFVGNIDEAAMVDYMSVPLISYKDTALEVSDVLNAMNEVANNNAIEMNDLGQAYKRASNTAASSGTTFSELTGLITAAQEATRLGGETIGTSLRTIDINFSKISSRITKADNDKFDFFKKIGVDIVDANGELRSTHDILKDLSGVWSELDSTDQSMASFYAGGKRHATTLQAIVKNWDDVNKATGEANEQLALFDKESGSAYEEFGKQQESVEYAVAGLKNAWAEFIYEISGGREGVKAVVDELTRLVEIGTKLAKNDTFMAFAKTFLKATLWLTANAAIHKVFTTLSMGAKATLGLISPLGKGIGTVAKATAVGSKAVGGLGKVFGIAKLGIGKFIPVVGGLVTAFAVADTVLGLFGISLTDIATDGIKKLVGAFGGLNAAVQEYAESTEKYSKEIEDNPLVNGEIRAIDDLINKYDELNKAKEEQAEKESEEQGIEVKPSYSPEEFEQLKEDFNTQIKDLGLDEIGIEIEVNSYDHIKKQLDELEEQKRRLEADSIKDYAESARKRNETLTSGKGYDKQRKETADDLKLERDLTFAEGTAQYDEYTERIRLAEENWGKYLELYEFNTKEFETLAKERTEKVEAQKKSRKNILDNLDLYDFSSISSGNAETMSGELASASIDVNASKRAFDELNGVIETNGKLTEEQYVRLAKFFPDIAGWGEDTTSDLWKSNADTIEGYGLKVEEQTNLYKTKFREVLEATGKYMPETIDNMVELAEGTTRDYIKLMDDFGEAGQHALGLTEESLAVYGDRWNEVMLEMQWNLKEIPEEIVTKYNLDTEEGLVNWETIDKLRQTIPEELVTRYGLVDEDGIPQLSEITKLLDEVDEEKLTELGILIDGKVDLDRLLEEIEGMDEEEVIKFFGDTKDLDEAFGIVEENSQGIKKLNPTVDMYGNPDHFEEEVANVEKAKLWLEGKRTVIQIDGDSEELDKEVEEVKESMWSLGYDKTYVGIYGDDSELDEVLAGVNKNKYLIDNDTTVADIDGDSTGFDEAADGVKVQSSSVIPNLDPLVKFWGNKDDFDSKANSVYSKAKDKSVTVSFLAKVSNTVSTWWNRLFGGGSKSTTISASFNSPTKLSSVGVEPNIGRALSRGVSQSVGVSDSQGVQQSTSHATSIDNNYDNDRPPAKVDQSVWRYWAKELFKGIPLENSMDDLNRSMTNAGDNQKQLISLYKQQIKLLDEQIAYEKDMKKAQQSEMNSLLSQLRKEGFKTSGNRITNLGHAKGMSGEKAERSTDLLNQWESLYRALDATNDKIKELNQEKVGANNSISDANEAIRLEAIEKELESIDKTLKRTKGLLTSVQNDMSIFTSKLGMIGGSDFELRMTITEEGVNKASKNVKTLTDEFNRLSKMSVKYSENADGIQSELEGLRTEILSNADSIIEYRNALQELELERMAADFDKYSTTIQTNLDSISGNIDSLRNGLLSGQSLGDLISSSLVGLDFSRKTDIEKQYEQRLQLEKELNKALDGFAQKNIDRVKNVANATLTVEKSKYNELLKLANGYSNGKVESASISSPIVGIGKTEADTSKDKSYQKWLDNLKAINNDYVEAYNSMVSKYDKAMSKAQTKSEKEILTNAMILDQLRLQEGIYQSIIDSNAKAIKQSESQLSNSSLTTEQREALLANIEEYRQSSVNAQNSIKDSIQSRFDLEFELLDEMTSKAQEYTDELSNMMDIAEAVGSGNDVMSELYNALFQSKVNEYANATDIIKDLTEQQAKFEEGSFEWNTLQSKIEETQDSLSDLTLDILNANKDILSTQMDIIQEASEKMALGGMNADGYDSYKNAWMDGVEKELELERLRMKLVGLEDKSLQSRLELMDRQEKVSRAELDYVDKQLEATRLQEKLENIRGERNVQTLAKDANGNWQWQYVADQTEYDSTKEELDDVRLEIEQYRDEQRRAYVDSMNDIIDGARNGEYRDIDELKEDIDNVNNMYDDILKDVDGMNLYDTDSIIRAYQDYLSNNSNIVSGITSGSGFEDTVSKISSKFEQTFINVTTDLSKIIADELKKALSSEQKTERDNGIIIEHQTLEFPNVKDANGLEEAFRSLPQVARQISTTK